jgi:hypothetical protein
MRGVCIERNMIKCGGKETWLLLKENKQSTVMQTKENITMIQQRNCDFKLLQYKIVLNCN